MAASLADYGKAVYIVRWTSSGTWPKRQQIVPSTGSIFLPPPGCLTIRGCSWGSIRAITAERRGFGRSAGSGTRWSSSAIRCAARFGASSAQGEEIAVNETRIRYRPRIDPELADRTDWSRLAGMTEDEIEAAALSDPDALPMTDEELAHMFRPRSLRALRRRLGLSQSEFAGRFHINLRTLARLGAGAAGPRRYRPRLPARSSSAPPKPSRRR